MKPMKIFTIGHSYVVRLNRAIMAKVAEHPDIDLTVAAPDFFYGDLRPLTLEQDQDPTRYRLQPLATRLSKRIHIFSYRNLAKALPKSTYDLVHAWEEPYIYAGYQIASEAKRKGYRYFFRTAQSLIKKYPFPFNRFERASVDAASGWVAGGQLVREAMLEKGFPDRNSRVITLAVDESHFCYNKEQRRDMRRKLQLTAPTIGYLGRFTDAKGLPILMQALEKVTQPWNLVMLGSGYLESSIQQWVKRRGLEERVRIVLASHDDVPAYLNAMDMLVAPSQTTPQWKEQFGRMVIEAFACKLPVIGSSSGEIPRVIGDAGLIVDEGDVQAWTTAIEDLLASAATRQQYAQAGYDRFQSYYTTTKVAANYINYYKQLMDSPA